MPGRKGKRIYRPKLIKKTTRRAYQKRHHPRPVTKAQIRRRFQVLHESLVQDIRRFQRNRSVQARRELLERIQQRVTEALEINRRHHVLRELRDECCALAREPVPYLAHSDLQPFIDALAAGTVRALRESRARREGD